MLLKSIKLSNIRSYVSQEINFPQGTLLLSGDIGSGKSTILLAIEFAMFGLLRGDLSGAALLRNGAEKGSVELEFELNNENITIMRKLKRTKTSVEQEAGHIIRNDMKKDATPQELKTEVLGLIGYPKDLLTKSKSLVYRYTVYTPQEAMKQIVLDDKESRLNILRKVFDIDKYKRIKENSLSYAKTLRETQKEYAGMIYDLEDKKKQMGAREKDVQAIKDEIEKIKPALEEARQKTEDKRLAIEKTEQKIKEAADKKRLLELAETRLKIKIEQNSSNASLLGELRQQIGALQKETEQEKEPENFSEKIAETGEWVVDLERGYAEINERITEARTKIGLSEETRTKISEMDSCPTCLQTVDQEHKRAISEKEDAKILELRSQLKKQHDLAEQNKEKLEALKKKRDELRELEKKSALLKVKKERLAEKEQRKKTIEEQQEKIKQEIGRLNEEKLKHSEAIKAFEGAEQEHRKVQSEFREASQKEKETEVQYGKLCEKKENMSTLVEELKQEIAKKEALRKKLEHLQKLHQWTNDFFIKTIDAIERQVMTRVYHEFNELFQGWFDILVEDESIQARLDDSFTPLVQQNGHDIEIDNLSGGEKTACALAYRLALNKVINDLITSIQTKDILILDEPTDGFSSEQIDKIRDVLEELGSRQVIIVSHDQKIESFVDNVLTIQKNEHVSQVM